MKKAQYEMLDDHTFYGEILGFKGVYANEPTLEDCRDELEATLEDWILFSLTQKLHCPPLTA